MGRRLGEIGCSRSSAGLEPLALIAVLDLNV